MNNNSKIINIYVNDNQKSLETALIVKDKLEQKGFKLTFDFDENALINLCIGGDGAFLRAVHKYEFSTIPFVGINTGHLGFYQEILIPNIDKFISDLINENYGIEKISLLESKTAIRNSSKTYTHKALNEFVVKSDDSSIVYLDVYIDDNHLESFAGDGIIVSTPSGSTAYNFSAGGSVLYHGLDGFQVTPLAPINSKAYRSLLNSLVVPSKSNVTLYFRDHNFDRKSSIVLADGLNRSYDNVDYVNFTYSDQYINKLVFLKDWYWLNIKDKFL